MEEASAKAAAARAKVEVPTPLTMTPPPSGLRFGPGLLATDAVKVVVGDRTLGPWTLGIQGPERIAVAGPNRAGKTTILEVAMGALAPSSGAVPRAAGSIAMLDQRVGILDRDASILANFRRINPALVEQATYAACACFALRNRDAL
ncbi:MAG: hypothetical protein ABSE69_11770 [Roseiarcus sp.]